MSDKRPNVDGNRRKFVKRASTGAALGLAGALLLGTPRRAEAFVWEIPAAIAEYYNLAKYYYETYVGQWLDKVDELKDIFNSDDPMIPSVLAYTDAANHVRTAIENMRQKRELEAQPSDQCAGENAAQAAELMEEIHNDLGKGKSSKQAAELKNIASDQLNHQASLINELNQSINAKPLEETLNGLSGTLFVGNRGYDDAEAPDQIYKSVTARLRLAISSAGGSNKRQLTQAATMLSRFSPIDNALSKIMSRRIPTQAAYDRAHEAALPYEQEILERMKLQDGLSQVDLENFEVRRTHESLTWQEMVDNSASATAMTKELALLQASSNHIDTQIHEMTSLINQVKSVRALEEMDSDIHPKERSSDVTKMLQYFMRTKKL